MSKLQKTLNTISNILIPAIAVFGVALQDFFSAHPTTFAVIAFISAVTSRLAQTPIRVQALPSGDASSPK